MCGSVSFTRVGMSPSRELTADFRVVGRQVLLLSVASSADRKTFKIRFP